MTWWHIVILAVIQGAAELLPVSSSAHVIVASRLMGIRNISSPQYMLMLVMLHTGTMFAVIAYFWKAWKRAVFSSTVSFYAFAGRVLVATIVTGVIGYGLKIGIEKYLAYSHHMQKAEIEELFDHLDLIAASLAAVGILILVAGMKSKRHRERGTITMGDSVVIGAVQGLCLPFRGFSRSGATISAGLLRGVSRIRLEEFSFALAVVLTPAVIWHEARRVFAHGESSGVAVGMHDFLPSILGMCCSFIAGLVALKILSQLLEKGQWWVFGVYCLAAAGGVYWMHMHSL